MSETAYYHLGKFPPEYIDWKELLPRIGPAYEAIARYDGKVSATPNPNILLTPLTTQEAVLSSRIEGTQATMGEVFEYEAESDNDNITEEKKGDIDEILNYRQAMWFAEELLKKLPLCQRVVRETHKILLQGVRGDSKAPGEYRRFQNWIGTPGSPIEKARFVPIPAEKLPGAMDKWEKYIHLNEPDRLVQLAIIHAEFEAIHPFLDGNGRLGRMLIPLFLAYRRIIQRPFFYISAYFEANRDEYYNRLYSISKYNEWTEWCKFFLLAITKQARENMKKAQAILNLYEEKKRLIVDITHSQYGIYALDYIFSRPVFKSTDFTANDSIPVPTAKRIIKVLKENKIIETLRESSGRRPALHCFPELLNVAEGRKAF